MASITMKNLKKFKDAYELARRSGKDIFTFEGQEVLVSYAKYVIEYADSLKKG